MCHTKLWCATLDINMYCVLPVFGARVMVYDMHMWLVLAWSGWMHALCVCGAYLTLWGIAWAREAHTHTETHMPLRFSICILFPPRKLTPTHKKIYLVKIHTYICVWYGWLCPLPNDELADVIRIPPSIRRFIISSKKALFRGAWKLVVCSRPARCTTVFALLLCT